MSLTASAAAAEVLQTAAGRGERHDPVLEGTGGPAGNARLTAWLGLVLLVLSVGQLLTLFDVRGFITWHVVIGLLLVPPALAKTASTGWRIARYYAGASAYRTAGPPPLLLRLLGPLVVASTLGLLGTGVLLVLVGPGTGDRTWVSLLGHGVGLVTLHSAVFWVWAASTGLHLLARLVPALRLTSGREGRVPGGSRRAVALVGAAAAAAVLAVLLSGPASAWGQDDRGHDGHGPRDGVARADD
jgi:hypothetical protein